jgi:hypothetical protein
MTSRFEFLSTRIAAAAFMTAGGALLASGCGGSSNAIAPIVLTVMVNQSTVTVPQGGSPVYVSVLVVAPTETVTFSISGLPAGVSASYKESESNPSGQLTLTANTVAPLGAYKPTIIVGSSGQTASTTFALIVSAPSKSNAQKVDSPAENQRE